MVFIFNLKFLPTVSIIFRTDVLNSPLLLVCWFLCHSVICCISDFEVVLFDTYMVVRYIPFYSIVPYTNIQLIKHPSLLLMTLFSLNSFSSDIVFYIFAFSWYLTGLSFSIISFLSSMYHFSQVSLTNSTLLQMSKSRPVGVWTRVIWEESRLSSEWRLYIIVHEYHSSCHHDSVCSLGCGEAALERPVPWVDISTGGLEVEMEK